MGEIFVKTLFLDDHKSQLQFWLHYKAMKEDNINGTSVDVLNHCAKLKHNLSSHFDAEEVLYSKYFDRSENLAGLIKRVREEHRRMLQIMDSFLDNDADDDKIIELISEFDSLLKGHIVLEEAKLYPALDEVLTDEEKAEVVTDLKNQCSGYTC